METNDLWPEIQAPRPLNPSNDALDPDRAAWVAAISLLTQGGMTEGAARRFFGLLLSRHHLTGRAAMPAIQAAQRAGTMDPRSYLTKAISNRVALDPAILCDWS